MVGAGGLGAPVLLYLAAAGVGTLGIVDDDMKCRSRICSSRYTTPRPDVGPAESAKRLAEVQRINPHVNVEPYAPSLPPIMPSISSAATISSPDGSDNFARHYLVSDASYLPNARW